MKDLIEAMGSIQKAQETILRATQKLEYLKDYIEKNNPDQEYLINFLKEVQDYLNDI